MVSASYVGTQSAHIWVSRQLNQAIIRPCPNGVLTSCNTTTNTNSRRLAQVINPTTGLKLGPTDMFESGGTSSYNGLILTTQKRLTRGVSFNANYTWSHCIGDVPIGSGVGGAGGTYTDVNNRARDRGNCTTPTLAGGQTLDRRHIFNLTAVLESPRFNDRAIRMFASNWKFSASYRYLSAAYLSATTGIDVALSGASNQRPNQLLANVLCDNPSPSCWINRNAFANASPGTLGNAGRSNILGPNTFGIDTALSRIFRVKEGISLEARGEAFNVTNSFRAGPVTTALNNNNFGRILTAQDPRIMQVALKLVF
jgi:hypothetical protein